MTAVRRLAAILAADVAGYSRLMGADEEGTLERLKALRRELLDPKIAEHHGRIVKTTGGGVLASVVDAVGGAVEVQQAMPERNAGLAADRRIDLNLGDVIVEGDDLYGDGVNIAADRNPGRRRRGVRLQHGPRPRARPAKRKCSVRSKHAQPRNISDGRAPTGKRPLK